MSIAGRSIVVCRATHQAGPLLERLERLGATPVHVPLIEIATPADGGIELRSLLDSADIATTLAFTSANGVDAVAHALDGERPRWRVAVVGGATADRARSLGWVVDHEASVATAAGLAASMPAAGRVIAPLAELASNDLVEGLRMRDIQVDAVTAYRTTLPDVSAGDLERILMSDALLVTAPSVVQRLVEALGAADLDVERLPPLVAIGPTSSAAIREVGLSVAEQASRPNVDGIIDAVLRTLTT